MRILLALLLLGPCLVFGQGESHVTAKLIADAASIEKGKPFTLGIHLEMRDDWHTYWEYPGFAGAPTTWSLEPVEGLEIQPLRFPFPKRFVDDAGYITFGYDDVALLTATAVYTGDADRIAIEGTIDWLECKELCIKGSVDASLELPVGEATPAETQMFSKFLARTPSAYDETVPFTFDTTYSFEAEQWRATVRLRPRPGHTLSKRVDDYLLYPLGNEFSELKEVTVHHEDGAVRLELAYEAWDAPPEDVALSGVLQLPTEDGPRYVRMQLHPSGGSAPASTTAAMTQEPVAVSAPVAEAAGPPDLTLWFALLLAFLGGVILNLMPCVLPVLSLKVFSLLEKAGESSGRRKLFGWIYTLGIMASFGVLSLFFVGAKEAGEELGIGFQFQNPYFVIGITALLFVMALSFFGVFHFGAPNSGKLQKLGMKAGISSAFFNGILMTILSTPCTAPMLGAAYAWALSQPSWAILLTFQVIALGLAFPYLLLCYAPALLRFLPKPGPWMKHLEMALGFLLMGTVVWLFSVLGELVGNAGVVGTLTALLGLGAALTIYGKSVHGEHPITAWGSMIGVVALTTWLGFFAIYDIEAPFRAKEVAEENLVLTYLSEQDGAGEDLYAKLESMQTTADEIAWVPFSEGNLKYFREQGRMVFLDFTAAWCVTCKSNERLVIDTASIRERFAEMDVVAMRGDYTNEEPHMTRFLERFGRAGVPMYVVYPGEGEPILLPEIITKSLVTDALDDAREELGRRVALDPPAGDPAL